jgi:hypothetical protein
MVKKVLPNRSSKTVKPDVEAKLQQVVQIFAYLLGEDTPMSEEEYKSLYKIADKRKQECDDVFGLMKTNPVLVKKPLSVVETQKDKDFYEFCDLVQATLASLKTKTDREQNIAGGEYVNSCSVFESDVNADAHRGDAQAQMVQADLKKINRNRSSGNAKKKIAANKNI